MKRFFSFIIKQSVAVVLFVIFVLAFGVYSTLNMSVNLLPDINVPMVCVQVIYPGANATSVEDDLTKPLEEGLSSISGITEVESYSYDNLSAVVLSFDYGTDTNGKKSDIQSKLATLTLPDGITTSVYEIDLNAQALAVLSLTSDVGEDDAYQKANELSKKLAALDGVESVSLKGGATYSYDVKPFGGLELVSPLIVEAFSYGALDIPLGNISEADGEVQIRNNSDIATVEDIKSMPIELPASVLSVFGYIKEQLADVTPPLSDSMLAFIKSTTGFNLSNELLTYILNTDFSNVTTNSDGESVFVTTVGEIATVEKNPTYTSYAYYYGGGVTLNEGNTIIIEVYKSNGANSSAVVKNVKKTYKSVSAAEGYNAKISLLDDQSEFISDSISNVLVSMIIGGVLAILVIFIFLKKVGLSLVIAITMPLSVLAALICLALMGITLNMVSLGGLAVGIGMLVDNSIVVIECISKHRDAGKSAYNAAVDGTVEVGGALFGSTLTTVCVFIPIIFAGGLTAEIFTDLSFAVIYSLAFSLIVAVTVIPTLYTLFESDRRMLKGGNLTPAKEEVENVPAQTQNAEVPEQTVPENTETPEKVSEKPKKKLGFGVLKQPVVMDKISSGYAKLLPKALAHRAVTLIVALVVFLASIGLLFLTGIEFLPSIDKGQIEIDMSYGSGRELSVVQEDVLSFSQVIVDNVDNIDYVSASVGKNGLLALTDTGIITVQLTTNRNTDKVVKKIRKLAEDAANKPIGTVKVKQIDGVVASLMSGSNDMSVTVVGEDSDTLIEISQKIENKLAAEGFIDITNSATDKSRQYTLNFDREKMSELGLDYQTVVLTMRIGIASYTACTATIDGEDYDLDVSFADGAVTNKTELENFVVGFNSKTNTQIHLKDILKGGEVKEEYTEACIRRSNGKSMILVSANLADSDTGTATKLMQSAAKEVLADYNGYSFESSGISSYLNDAFEGLAVALVVSFFLLYAVMAIQFSSFVKPLIVMASIPFSFTGGFIALVITGTSLNVVSFIGLIMLMGVVVNNAIVMLEKIKQLNEDGKTKYDSVVEACRLRLRPILMTTLTTILALVPLAIGVGQGSELMQPLGIVVIGGLLLSTLVTLVLVPTVYCAVYGITPKQKDGRAKGQKDKCGGCR